MPTSPERHCVTERHSLTAQSAEDLLHTACERVCRICGQISASLGSSTTCSSVRWQYIRRIATPRKSKKRSSSVCRVKTAKAGMTTRPATGERAALESALN